MRYYEEELEVGTVEIEADSKIVMANEEEVTSEKPVIATIEEETEKGE